MVVLTLKNLQQQTFSVEIELSATVKALKEKVEKEKGSDYPAVGQKLIYAGKILQDDSTLDSYNIDDKKFLVIMVTKPKPAPPPSGPSDPTETGETEEATTEAAADTAQSTTAAATTEASSTSTSSTTATTTTTTTTSASSQPADTPTTQSGPTTQPTSGGSVGSAESLIVVGEEFNRMVENIMEMGYERPQVERALRASFNNPYTAVQYLVDGIPPNLEEPAGQPAGGGGGGDEPVSAEGEPDVEGDPLSFLRSQPQFEQMRQMIRSNPSLLDAFIQQIGQTNPQLLQAIQQNQEAFVRMLNEGGSGSGGGSTGSSGTQGSGGGGGGGGGGSGGRAAPGQTAIFLSPQDRDAIDRLKALGNFPEDVVVQAYFACEKNENLAAEFLFSQTWD